MKQLLENARVQGSNEDLTSFMSAKMKKKDELSKFIEKGTFITSHCPLEISLGLSTSLEGLNTNSIMIYFITLISKIFQQKKWPRKSIRRRLTSK